MDESIGSIKNLSLVVCLLNSFQIYQIGIKFKFLHSQFHVIIDRHLECWLYENRSKIFVYNQAIYWAVTFDFDFQSIMYTFFLGIKMILSSFDVRQIAQLINVTVITHSAKHQLAIYRLKLAK